MTTPGQNTRSLNLSTSQALGAGIAAGALALYVWRRNFSGSKSSACDTPEAGNESDEVVLYGKGRRPHAHTSRFDMQDGCDIEDALVEYYPLRFDILRLTSITLHQKDFPDDLSGP